MSWYKILHPLENKGREGIEMALYINAKNPTEVIDRYRIIPGVSIDNLFLPEVIPVHEKEVNMAILSKYSVRQEDDFVLSQVLIL